VPSFVLLPSDDVDKLCLPHLQLFLNRGIFTVLQVRFRFRSIEKAEFAANLKPNLTMLFCDNA